MSDSFLPIQVYLVTSGLIKYSQIHNPNNYERKILKESYNLFSFGSISLFTTQGSYSDIFGDNDEKINSKNSQKSAENREKTRVQLTFTLATDYIESKSDFDNNDIKLFNLLFDDSTTTDNIFDKYSSLKNNDKVDYCIIKDSLKDANNLSFFITQNPRDFIYNGKKKE